MTARVLVLDDEPGILALCERLLQHADYEVKASSRPQQVLNLLRHVKWDLLIVDIRMPGMSGFDVVRETKKIQPDMAVLVMTGFGTLETAIQALRQGVDGLLLKPFDADEFLQAVAQALRDNQDKKEALKSRMLRPLFDITETLLTETRPAALDALIVSSAMTYFRSENVAFYERKGEQLIRLASRGAVPPDASDPFLAYALVQESPLLLNYDDPLNKELRDAFGARALRSVMIVPAQRPDTCFYLFAGRAMDAQPFHESDLDMLSILARQASVAMENARLYDSLRTYINKLEASQQALVQAEKMAAAGRLSASLAHEINNPLQSVQNCLHLSQQASLPEEKRQAYFSLASQELNRLSKTVRHMLDFYRRAPSAVEDVDVHQVLARCRDLLATEFKRHKIDLDWQLQAEDPLVRGVENQLQQVFVNLMLNAHDAMPAGGVLTVRTESNDEHLTISFSDTGPGVPEEMRERIFEPFASTKEHGTGLGLTVSYNIVSSHYGALWLDKQFKSGARFVVQLSKRAFQEVKQDDEESPYFAG